MEFPPLLEGRLLRRHKRFFADVELCSGERVTAHCANTGRMTGVCEPGMRVWLQPNDNPRRRLRYSWVLVEPAPGELACVDTGRANALVAEAITAGRIAALAGYAELRREVRYGVEGSRIDLLLEGDTSGAGRADCYVEVKNVTLHLGDARGGGERSGDGAFPDAVSARGSKHLRELMHAVAAGQRSLLCFHVAHSGIRSVRAAGEIDPHYATTLREALDNGVEVLAIGPLQASPQRWLCGAELPFNPPSD